MTYPMRNDSSVAPLHWAWTIAFCLCVLLIGLWFVTRRREIRPKGDAAFEPATIRPDAGET